MTETNREASTKDPTTWDGFHFAAGFFVLTTPRGDGKNRVAFGKLNPVTKEIEKWTEIVDEE